MRRTCLAFSGLVAGLCFSAGIACADPVGQWTTEKGYAKIRIENCGNALWGAVAWEQTTGIDNKNPDPSKKGRPTLGMPVLLDMKPVQPNKWAGHIYNSEDGQTYSSNISVSPNSPDVLQVRGCVLGFLCGGEDWIRVKDDPAQPGGASVPGGAVVPSHPAAPAANQPRPNSTSTMSAQKPGAVAVPPRPVDIATASVEDFCAAVTLNGAPAPIH